MLSRAADAVYWMSRYLERAGNIARFLDVNWHLTLDVQDQYLDQWMPLVVTTGDYKDFQARYQEESKEGCIYFLTADPVNPNSILSCARAARQNAIFVRDILPADMWEAINVLYHQVQHACERPETIQMMPNSFCADVKWRSLTIGGIAWETMSHNEPWRFFRLGALLERADKTSRILDVKYFMLLPSINHVGSTLDYIQWGALLKAVSGFQAFRHDYGRIVPEKVAEFLILDRVFPRSILYCLSQAQSCLHDLTGNNLGRFTTSAERYLGQICSSLSYKTIQDIFDQGLHEFTEELQMKMNRLDTAVFDTFFSLWPGVQQEVVQEQINAGG
ncbi:protein of unknown function DUF403 [Desulfonatronospira thiodismutans ASO3-1]|uniref:DUF403 domain-containing protein n=1 Tax=Desulfonatronospira thiodismutans ASO3-1 TaxID=555779 RepID=D6SMB5_9BACT|nr:MULTISPECIES: alpha-E domain-containing protein [Desulfonatronospira]EFI35826.1 protein of unknown function DUF403 [Desulfonatronospira thiodismutans ASO3-1]RQD78966.1 MAG: alpha-E domain-containing protein [Desulfonatronospira sp. MSAO_Bac3]